jgi:hypothetical protein
MSIPVSEIKTRVLAALDDEGSLRYSFANDIKPNLNSAIEILVTWFNQAFAEKKISAESLSEITYVKVWQANSYSRVAFNETAVGHSKWTLLGVYPKPVVNKKSSMSAKKDDSVSRFMPEISFVSSDQSARRLTLEEWNENSQNAFMDGNLVIGKGLAEYGYLDFANYSSNTYDPGPDKMEITIRPYIPNELVAMAYLKYPTLVASEGDSIEFPKSLTELITEITLNKISTKQSDQTNLYGVSTQNVNRLVSLMK